MTDNPFDLYSLDVCGSGGDIPGWMARAICALAFVLHALDAIGG